jgi:hypothetical protein
MAAVLGAAAVARAEPAPANLVAVTADEVAEVAARLAGHRVTVAADRRAIRIDDVAGAGAPRVGVVARDGEHLVLDAADGRWRLAGPLARPRIAGPGYTVWVVGGAERHDVPTLTIQRLGVLKRPARSRDPSSRSNALTIRATPTSKAP